MITTSDVQAFFNQMDNDMAEVREMIRTEENLIAAVKAYQKAWDIDPSKDMVIRADRML